VRPALPSDARDQAKALRFFGRILRQSRLAHAYLLSGPSGVGKERLALFLSKILLCDVPDIEKDPPLPCGKCPGCRKVDRAIHPDLAIVRPDGAMIKIQQIRELQRRLAYPPLEARRRVCVIAQAERMNPEAANALLKTLEEPTPGTHHLLTASSAGNLLPTVVSRCQTLRCAPLSVETLEDLLRNESACPAALVPFLARTAQGSISRARQLAAQDIASIREKIFGFLAGPAGSPIPRFFSLSKEMAGSPEILMVWVQIIRSVVLDVMLYMRAGEWKASTETRLDPTILVNRDLQAEIRAMSSWYDWRDLEDYSLWLDGVEGLLQRNVNREFLSEAALAFWFRKRREDGTRLLAS